MRWIKLHEPVKVPVFKNVIFALKLVWKADKKLLLGYFVTEISNKVLSMYVQNILFLKVLLSIIDGKADFKTYFTYLLLFFGTYLAVNVISAYAERTRLISSKVVLKNVNNKIFEKATQLDVSCYENPEFYDKYQRATLVLSSSYYDLICWDVAAVVGGVIALICVITTVTVINPMYLLFLLPVTLVFAVEILKSKAVYKRDLEMTTNNRIKAYIQRTMFLKEFSKDMRTSNIFAVLINRFKKAINGNVEILKKYGLKLFIYSMLSSLFSDFIPIIGTYAFAGYQFIFTKALSISNFSVVLSSINSVRDSTLSIAEAFDEMSQMALFFQNLRDFFDYEPKITDGGRDAGEFESLEFKNVTFGYPDTNRTILKNISFKISKGETIAVVGVNGAGKSTMINLCMRLYDPSLGKITIDGVDIKDIPPEELRNSIGVVFQETYLFSGTIFDNIAYARPNASLDEVIAAAKAANAHEFITKLPDGYNTVIGENGHSLSGGERQRIGIARALYRKADVLLLDEATSSLDPATELKVLKGVQELTPRPTCLLITHRLSVLEYCDRQIKIDNHKVVNVEND